VDHEQINTDVSIDLYIEFIEVGSRDMSIDIDEDTSIFLSIDIYLFLVIDP
jgi:hypothetical protein